MTKFAVKKAQLEILEKFANLLEDMKKDATHDYRIVGKEEEQARDWKTDELLWEDAEKTIPKYRTKWDYVPYTKEELPEEKAAMLKAIEEMEKSLDKLV